MNLDNMAIGVTAKDFVTMAITSPGASLSISGLVASGVTSRGENPVPPVVKISATPRSSDHCCNTFCKDFLTIKRQV